MNNDTEKSAFRTKLRESRKLNKARSIVFNVIDFFYPPFQSIMPLKTFRYAACGGGVALLNLVVFAIANNFIVEKNSRIDLGFIEMQSYTAAFIIALCVSFPIGFLLNRYIVFQTSTLRGRVQLFRYASMTGLNIFLNYTLLHFFVGLLGFWATPSQAVTTVLLAVLSYFVQNYFSFKEQKSKEHYE